MDHDNGQSRLSNGKCSGIEDLGAESDDRRVFLRSGVIAHNGFEWCDSTVATAIVLRRLVLRYRRSGSIADRCRMRVNLRVVSPSGSAAFPTRLHSVQHLASWPEGCRSELVWLRRDPCNGDTVELIFGHSPMHGRNVNLCTGQSQCHSGEHSDFFAGQRLAGRINQGIRWLMQFNVSERPSVSDCSFVERRGQPDCHLERRHADR